MPWIFYTHFHCFGACDLPWVEKVNLKDFTERGGLPVPRPADKEMISLHPILTKSEMLNKMKHEQLFWDMWEKWGHRVNHCPQVWRVAVVQLLSCSVVSNSSISWTAACQASLSITNSRSLLQLMSIESVMPSNHLILCCPLLLLSVFPSIRVFSNESVLHICEGS